jgi:hypothetical protein
VKVAGLSRIKDGAIQDTAAKNIGQKITARGASHKKRVYWYGCVSGRLIYIRLFGRPETSLPPPISNPGREGWGWPAGQLADGLVNNIGVEGGRDGAATKVARLNKTNRGRSRESRIGADNGLYLQRRDLCPNLPQRARS